MEIELHLCHDVIANYNKLQKEENNDTTYTILFSFFLSKVGGYIIKLFSIHKRSLFEFWKTFVLRNILNIWSGGRMMKYWRNQIINLIYLETMSSAEF